MDREASQRILLIDDERALRDMLTIALTQAGFDVRALPDGSGAREYLKSYDPQCILLDVMLPEIDGFTLLSQLRQFTEVPIVMLSAKTELDEKVTGLSRGADDYVSKPFELLELVARIRATLRRPSLTGNTELHYHDLTVNITKRSVARGERRVELSAREFDLLLTLMQEPGRIFSREQLLDLVWGYHSTVYVNTLEAYISYLRAKIDSSEPVKLIKTYRGMGYALEAQA
jgi:DNA-binding response OmpR family regulator